MRGIGRAEQNFERVSIADAVYYGFFAFRLVRFDVNDVVNDALDSSRMHIMQCSVSTNVLCSVPKIGI